jgi:hypothetical protein
MRKNIPLLIVALILAVVALAGIVYQAANSYK